MIRFLAFFSLKSTSVRRDILILLQHIERNSVHVIQSFRARAVTLMHKAALLDTESHSTPEHFRESLLKYLHTNCHGRTNIHSNRRSLRLRQRGRQHQVTFRVRSGSVRGVSCSWLCADTRTRSRAGTSTGSVRLVEKIVQSLPRREDESTASGWAGAAQRFVLFCFSWLGMRRS